MNFFSFGDYVFWLCALIRDWDDVHLHVRHFRRQHQAFVVAMNYDDCAYEPRSNSPAGLPNVVFLLVFADERDVEDFGEVLSEVVAGAPLPRCPIGAHSLSSSAALV